MVLKNVRQEAFIQEIVKGNSQRKAYRVAYPNSIKWKDEVVDSKASTLFNSGKVLERYQELLKKSEDDTIMSAVERKQWLSSIIKEELEKTDSKLKAIDILNKMDGEYINKVEVSRANDETIKEMDDYFANKKASS